MIGIRDVILKGDKPKEFLMNKHENYLKQYADDPDNPEQILAEHIKMSGMYWGLNALFVMNTIVADTPEVDKALEFIKRCQSVDGGFAAAPKHDSHILHTLSAIQILVIVNKCQSEYVDIESCASWIKSLQQPDGSFAGDKWGEVDTRFSFCALATLQLLDKLNSVDIDKAVEFVMACHNQIDGGFGRLPGSESHAAYVYCCVGSLAIADKLNLVDAEQLGHWLSERQLPSGGLNGRPQKLPDVCYSWWCLASMKMINKLHLIDHKRLLTFIMACQDEEQGGFSDRPGNWVDPFHTMLGIASVSLLSHHHSKIQQGEEVDIMLNDFVEKLKPVNPVLCMPESSLPGVISACYRM